MGKEKTTNANGSNNGAVLEDWQDGKIPGVNDQQTEGADNPTNNLPSTKHIEVSSNSDSDSVKETLTARGIDQETRRAALRFFSTSQPGSKVTIHDGPFPYAQRQRNLKGRTRTGREIAPGLASSLTDARDYIPSDNSDSSNKSSTSLLSSSTSDATLKHPVPQKSHQSRGCS